MAGAEPKRLRGAPPGPRIPPEGRTKPRSVRLNNVRWAKYLAIRKKHGEAWLARVIDEETARSAVAGL